MTVQQRIAILDKVGNKLKQANTNDNSIYRGAYTANKWFTAENTVKAVETIANEYLNEDELTKWLSHYKADNFNESNTTVGLILAGNIPLVGLHDFICCYVLGFNVNIKLSSKDEILFKYFLSLLKEEDATLDDKVKIVDRLNDIDAIIATGSNNSNRYFEYYFKQIPNILRRQRNAVALLTGKESKEQLSKLADDIFIYFGMGCRNVTKLYVPKGYKFDSLFEQCSNYEYVKNEQQYMGNLEYYATILLMKQVPFYQNQFLILQERDLIAAPPSIVHYEFYDGIESAASSIKAKKEEIQCVVAEGAETSLNTVPFGSAQSPSLFDYADGVDTIQFLMTL